MPQSIDGSLSLFRDRIHECVKAKRSIMITTHIDCDGLTSGSIVAKALVRAGATCTLRTANEFSKELVESLKSDSRTFHIVTDLGGGFAGAMDEHLGDDWLILDHHQIPDEEMDNPNVINAWKYGLDGGVEICAGGMAYLASVALDEANEDLSAVAMVSALGDRQDQGERKSFTGKNFEISETAKGLDLLTVDLNLLLAGRETKPLVESLAYTSQPYIEGLTWNRTACTSLLKSSGVDLKVGGRWRVSAELDDDEKRKIIEAITRFISGAEATEITSELIGYTYTFPNEDRGSFLRDGREYSTMLNSCGRIGRSAVGMAICMGDRDRAVLDAGEILSEYRKKIRECMNILSNERWRMSGSDSHIIINGQDVVAETMAGTISSLMASSPNNAGKVVILRTGAEGNMIKFSSRKAIGYKGGVNLGLVMRKGGQQFGGLGGGHDAAAGAKIAKDKLDDFLNYLKTDVAEMQSADSSG